MRTSSYIAVARSQGIYASPEQGMIERANTWYSGDPEVEIMYAGPNAHNGMQPHVWYVIAEVRVHARSAGSILGPDDCDAPGSYFLQMRDGWVQIPEGNYPELMGIWMKVFGMAGSGEAEPSTHKDSSSPTQFCQSP